MVTEEGKGQPGFKTGLTLYIGAKSGKKRPYVYGFHKSRTCSHPQLVALSIGGNWYRCTDCNYAFDIVAAYQQPLHNLVIGGMLNALHFAKEYGIESLQTVLRTPIGQYDGEAHKPVLPDGMSFMDAAKLLEEVDVNTSDGGKAQLTKLLEDKWVMPPQRALQDARNEKKQRKLIAAEVKKQLKAGGSNGVGGDGGTPNEDSEGGAVPALQKPQD